MRDEPLDCEWSGARHRKVHFAGDCLERFNRRRNLDLVVNLRIGSCLPCVYRVMDARGKFREHERSVKVARGVAESNSSFLSALQTSQGHP